MPRLRIPRIKKMEHKGKVSIIALIRKLMEGYKILEKQKRESIKAIWAKRGAPYPPYPYKIKGELKGKVKPLEMKKPAGIEIPTGEWSKGFMPAVRPEELKGELRNIDIYYPLIPYSPKRGEKVFAYARIKWDSKEGAVLYNVIEPKLSFEDKEMIEKIKKMLEERLDISFTKLGKINAKELLKKELEEIISVMSGILEDKKEILAYYIERDTIGLGPIEPFMNDLEIEDISCDGEGIPMYVYHRDPRFASLKTNVIIETKDDLNSFVMRLAQKCEKMISIAEPLLDASLPDGSRLQATLGTDIARRGSNFTIRRFTEKPLTPSHMLKYKTLNSIQLAFLWLAIENGKSMLISGGTATGKTSLLNSLSLFITPSSKIVSIEDTPELRLPHPHWVPHVARTPISIKGEVGEVSLFDLLKSSLRQRPDYLVVGEVRGKEAYVLFQQIASIPGYERVLVLNDNNLKRLPIEELNDGKKYRVPTIDPETGKIKILPLKMKVEHSPVKELYKIKTRTGREIITTGAHSVFTYTNKIEPIVVSEMKEGSKIVIPARLPCGYNDMNYLDLLELLPDIRLYSPKLIKKASRKLGFDRASKTAGFACISHYYGINNCALPLNSFKKLMEKAGIDYNLNEIKVRFERGGSPLSKAKLRITPELLKFLAYYISEGSINRAYRNNSISLYSKNNDILKDMRKCIMKIAGKSPKERETHGFGTATELKFNNKTIFEILKRFCGFKSDKKKVPDFIFGLSKKKIGYFLSGLYSGDAYLGRDYFGYYTTSKELANDISNLLLVLGIVARIRKRKRKSRKTTDYEIIFYRKEEMDKLLEYVKPIGKKIVVKQVGRDNVKIKNDIYIDDIKSITKIKTPRPLPVYDLSVPGTQNFIGGFGGTMLHNTGHPSMATIHAASIPQLVDRLITPPISLPPTLLENIDIIVFLVLTRRKGKYVRRANEILEVWGVEKEKIMTTKIFQWNPVSDKFEPAGKSKILEDIAKRQGLTEETVKDELMRRKRILEWMKEKEIYNYEEVSRIISTYYSNPERVMNLIEA